MNIKGNRVLLRAVEEEDLDFLQEWANEPDIQYMLGGWHFPTSKQDQLKWYTGLSCTSFNQRFMVINENGEIIGMANLININFKDGNAEHGLLLDKRFQGKGYGGDVLRAIMKYSFEELRLNRLETTIIANNEHSLNLFIKNGWLKEGILRDWYFRRGEFIDKIILGTLKSDYFKSNNNGKE